jgi:hypothetical protein
VQQGGLSVLTSDTRLRAVVAHRRLRLDGGHPRRRRMVRQTG